MSFVHLHTHSYYSLLSWVPSPKGIVKFAKKQWMSAASLTDLWSTYGLLDFYDACKKEWIKAILWCEIYIAQRGLHRKETRADGRPYNLVLIAENNEWYLNLLRISTTAYLEWMYYKPRIDYEVLQKHSEWLIAIDSWVNTHLAKLIIEHWSDDDIKKCIEKNISIFWKDNYFLALIDHTNTPIQLELNEKYKEIAKEYWIWLVVTQNSFYLKPEDAEAQDVIVCIWLAKDINDHARFTMVDEDYSMRTAEEIINWFSETPDAIENTLKIAERCNVTLELWTYHIPDFIPPKESWCNSPLELFRKLCIEWLKERYSEFWDHLESINWINLGESVIDNQKINISTKDKREDNIDNSKEYESKWWLRIAIRFEHEFKIIQKVWFESYFLMVADYVNWAKNNKILVWPWRWSWAWSIIAYAMWITNLDPLKYWLLFERFLNPERVSMPDFDVDFADDKRDQVIKYVTDKYWKDRVAQISTFGTMAARAAIKDVWRTYWIWFWEMNEFSKLIPDRPWTTLEEAWDGEEDLRKFVDSNESYRKVWDVARKLEWNVRHISVHACAVVIADKSLDNYTALQHPPKDSSIIITQYDAKPLEKLWLLKMDFLWLKNLSILGKAVDIIQKNVWVTINIDEIWVEDWESYKLFQEWNTTWIFQFESGWMKRYLKDLKPTRFEDLIAMNALYRPWPMEFIPKYIEWKYHPDKIKYPHPSLKWILEETYWIAVYQEQILQIAQIFAWYSLGNADILRRAIWKKIIEEMNAQRINFIEWAKKIWNKEDLAKKIFDDIIVPFAWYWFNKSHAAAYSMIAYQTAYLKAHYPVQFMAALLTADKDNSDRIAIEIDECTQMWIEVLPPDINESFEDFTVVWDWKIRFWLSWIKNLWNWCIEWIISTRTKEKLHFDTIEDFLSKIEVGHINRKNLEALIKSWACDSLCERNSAYESIEIMTAYAKEKQKSDQSWQTDLFSMMEWDNSNTWSKFEFKKTKAATIEEKLEWEKEFLWLFVSMHPLAWIEEYINKRSFDLNKLDKKALDRWSKSKFCWLITDLKVMKTKKWDNFALFKIETPQWKIDCACFSSSYQANKKNIHEWRVVLLEWILKLRNNEVQINVDSITRLNIENLRKQANDEWNLKTNTRLKINIPQIPLLEEIQLPEKEIWKIKIPYFASPENLNELKKIINNNPWDIEVEILLPNWKIIKPQQKVNLSDKIKAQVINLWQTWLSET